MNLHIYTYQVNLCYKFTKLYKFKQHNQHQISMRIVITPKSNEKMLENFNHEDYPDITIQTQTNKISLVLAFLTIDSQFFAELDPSTSTLDLSHLPQRSLIQVLRSLYGDQLVAESIAELEQLYEVINELKIEDYKTKIEQRIQEDEQLLENIEVLEFCFKNNLICQQIKNYHFETNLKSLEDNRKFLQLNKISLPTLIPILLEYHQRVGDSANSIINNILENYFNRNNIRPAQFFEDQDVEVLQMIWEQYHHSLQILQKKPSRFKTSQSIIAEFPSGVKTNKIKATSLKEEKELLELKDARIAELKEEIEDKEKQISKLRDQLYDIKRISFPVQKTSRRMQSIPIIPIEDEQISILDGVRKSKNNQKSLEQGENSLSENAFREQKEKQKNVVKSLQHQKLHRF